MMIRRKVRRNPSRTSIKTVQKKVRDQICLSEETFPTQFSNREISLACASIPSREEALKDWVVWALGQPVQHVRIYLDRWEKRPDWIPQKIETEIGDFRALGKFFWSDNEKIHVICDDDILYPEDYVVKMLAFLETKKSSVVCVHGSIIKKKFSNYYSKNSREVIMFGRSSQARKVDIPGTGTIAYDGTEVNIKISDFERNVGVDSEMAFLLAQRGHEVWTISRGEGWLKVNEKVEKTESLSGSSMRRDKSDFDVSKHQTETVKKIIKLRENNGL